MNKSKSILLAICFGCIVAAIFNAIAPSYDYYVLGNQTSKEGYIAAIESYSGRYGANAFESVKRINVNALVIGAAVAVVLFLVNPLSKKAEKQGTR